MFLPYSDRLWYLECEEATDRPVLGYLRGSRMSLMIDAGNSAAHALHFLSRLEEHAQPLPRLVALTHSHWDHCYGLHAIDAVGIACEQTRRDLARDASLRWEESELQKNVAAGIVAPFCAEHMRMEYPDLSAIRVTLPQILFEDKLVLDLGDRTAVLLHLENPHSRDGVVVWCPEERAVFLGDTLCEELVGSDWVDHPALVKSYLAALEKLDFTICFPGHSAPMSRAELFAELGERCRV